MLGQGKPFLMGFRSSLGHLLVNVLREHQGFWWESNFEEELLRFVLNKVLDAATEMGQIFRLLDSLKCWWLKKKRIQQEPRNKQ